MGVCVRVCVSACLHVCVCLCYLGSYGRLLPTFAVTAADIAFWYQCNVGKCINKRCSTYCTCLHIHSYSGESKVVFEHGLVLLVSLVDCWSYPVDGASMVGRTRGAYPRTVLI